MTKNLSWVRLDQLRYDNRQVYEINKNLIKQLYMRETKKDSHLQQVRNSQIHHEHHSLFGFSGINPEHPQRQHITQQAWC